LLWANCAGARNWCIFHPLQGNFSHVPSALYAGGGPKVASRSAKVSRGLGIVTLVTGSIVTWFRVLNDKHSSRFRSAISDLSLDGVPWRCSLSLLRAQSTPHSVKWRIRIAGCTRGAYGRVRLRAGMCLSWSVVWKSSWLIGWKSGTILIRFI